MLSHAGILSAAILALAPHPNSVSSSRIRVEAVGIRLEIRCQAATLLESVPLDRDGDRRRSTEELEAGRALATICFGVDGAVKRPVLVPFRPRILQRRGLRIPGDLSVMATATCA
jgi:hypothetical protein